jgi:prevent-host-death family protein
MKEISATEARETFSDVISRASFGKERVVVVRNGTRLVAVIPYEDLELLEQLEDQADARAIDEARAEQGNSPPITHAKLKARLKL